MCIAFAFKKWIGNLTLYPFVNFVNFVNTTEALFIKPVTPIFAAFFAITVFASGHKIICYSCTTFVSWLDVI